MTEFLTSRVAYLKTLPALQPGWLSGHGNATAGAAPRAELAEQLITLLTDLAALGVVLDSHTLLLGPIPAGGIGLDLRTTQGLATLQLFNDAPAVTAFEWLGDDWQEQELPIAEAIARFKAALRPTARPINGNPIMANHTTTQFWDQGVKAFHDGLTRKDCPYRLIGLRAQQLADEGQKRADWISGFNHAHECDQAA